MIISKDANKKLTNIIVHKLQMPESDVPVCQRPIDGYINVTQICKAEGKEFSDWYRLDDTKRYLSAVGRSLGIPRDLLVQSVTNGPNAGRGTWAHPRPALRIAQWCSPEVAAQVDEWLEAWIRGDIGVDLNTRNIIRMLFHPTASPWEKTFSNDFYYELARLYHLSYDPKRGAPGGMYAASLTDKLIYSRFPNDIRQIMRDKNPVINQQWKRGKKHFQFFKPELQSQLDDMIDLCTRLMKRYSDRIQFECAWDLFWPKDVNNQMLLFSPQSDSNDTGVMKAIS